MRLALAGMQPSACWPCVCPRPGCPCMAPACLLLPTWRFPLPLPQAMCRPGGCLTHSATWCRDCCCPPRRSRACRAIRRRRRPSGTVAALPMPFDVVPNPARSCRPASWAAARWPVWVCNAGVGASVYCALSWRGGRPRLPVQAPARRSAPAWPLQLVLHRSWRVGWRPAEGAEAGGGRGSVMRGTVPGRRDSGSAHMPLAFGRTEP